MRIKKKFPGDSSSDADYFAGNGLTPNSRLRILRGLTPRSFLMPPKSGPNSDKEEEKARAQEDEREKNEEADRIIAERTRQGVDLEFEAAWRLRTPDRPLAESAQR